MLETINSYIKRACLAGLLVILSCSPAIGYGVVLWPSEQWNIEAGSFVEITSESMIRDELGFSFEKTDYVTPQWRLLRFDSRLEAQNFAEMFISLKTLYARSSRRSLPIRSEKKTGAEILYRLDANEEVKVLSIDPETVDLSGLVSQWYEVLTRDGTRGWVFGYYLDVYDSTQEQGEQRASSMIETLFYTMWRPAYYEEYINTNQIDLDRFNHSLGVGIDPHEAVITVSLPNNRKDYSYTGITAGSGKDRFIFEDAPIEVEFISETRLYVYVKQENGLLRYEFIKLTDPEDGTDSDFEYLEHLIRQEQERRATLLATLLARSKSFVSATYGILLFQDNGSFVWNNYEALVPDVIPNTNADTGTILFSVRFENPDDADGVVSFLFDKNAEAIHFAYTVENSGVRLQFIPKQYIEANSVKGLPKTSLTVFFSFDQ